MTSCHAELVTQLSRVLPPALGLNHRLQQHPQGTCVGILALELSSPKPWSLAIVPCFIAWHYQGSGSITPTGSFVGLDVNPEAFAFQAPGVELLSALQETRNHPQSKVCHTCSPSISLNGHIKVCMIFPGDGGQDPVRHAETK